MMYEQLITTPNFIIGIIIGVFITTISLQFIRKKITNKEKKMAIIDIIILTIVEIMIIIDIIGLLKGWWG